MMSSCNVFVRSADTLIVASARTKPGFEIDAAPVFKLAANEAPVAIGKAVLEALNSYRVNVNPPPSNAAASSPLLQIAGAKGWSQLERVSRNILVVLEAGQVSAIPTRHDPEGGFTHMRELAISCKPIDEEIGIAIARAALLCS